MVPGRLIRFCTRLKIEEPTLQKAVASDEIPYPCSVWIWMRLPQVSLRTAMVTRERLPSAPT